MHIQEAQDTGPFEISHKWLRDHNSQYVTNNFVPIRLLAYDNGELVGSLDGEIVWGKLQIDNLVTHPDVRNQGIGKRLMQQAEKAAIKNKCTGIYLDTMSFQAKEFYLKMEFIQIGEISGFENETIKYFFHKPI